MPDPPSAIPPQAPPRVKLVLALPQHQIVLENLFQLYCQHFNEFIRLPLLPDGRFDCPSLDGWWTAKGHHPFLIKLASSDPGTPSAIVGFALVRCVSSEQPLWDMAEFFVLRDHRHAGVGTRAAHQTFTRFPGEWQVRVMQRNLVAMPFWSEAIQSFTGRRVTPTTTEDARGAWDVYSFSSPAPPLPR